jgi:hypothetical protein
MVAALETKPFTQELVGDISDSIHSNILSLFLDIGHHIDKLDKWDKKTLSYLSVMVQVFLI